MPLISFKNLWHYYNHPLFENISENIEIGDFLALYGPSGVGKSTFLQILGQLLKPKNGSITFHTFHTERQKAFWYAFVGGPFFEEMTTKENILFLQNFSNIKPDLQKYEEMLEFFKMKKFENIPVKSLSIGQRERVNIIRAFVHNPEIIILDEPGSNLDDKNFAKLFEFLKKEKESKKNAIIIATHNPKYREIANKIITLDLIEND